MTNLEEKNQQQNQEIDLAYFFKPVGVVFNKLASAISWYVRTLAKNFLLFAAIVVFMGAVGFFVRYLLPKAYETEGIYLSHTLPGAFCKSLVGGLNQFTGGGRKTDLMAHELKISTGAAGAIKSFDVTLLPDSLYINSSKRDTSIFIFRVTLITGDAAAIPEIQEGVVGFLENNEFSVKRKKAHLKSLMALDNDLSEKLKGLDSVKRLVNNAIVPRGSGQGIILGEPINPVSIYQEEMIYYKEKLAISETLASYTNIEVIQPFYPVVDYNYPHVNTVLRNFILAGILLALIAVPVLGRKPGN